MVILLQSFFDIIEIGVAKSLRKFSSLMTLSTILDI